MKLINIWAFFGGVTFWLFASKFNTWGNMYPYATSNACMSFKHHEIKYYQKLILWHNLPACQLAKINKSTSEYGLLPLACLGDS